MSSRIPLLTVAVSFFLLAGVLVWIATQERGRPSPEPRATAQASDAPRSSDERPAGSAPDESPSTASAGPTADDGSQPFTPPPRDALPEDEFGAMVRKGEQVFSNTQAHAREFVGNDLQCANCHLDAGRLADSAPLWAAWGEYPAFRGKNKHVNDFAERIQGCFRYSMNGTPPPRGDEVLLALQAYSYWLASGAPVGESLPGRGYPELDEPEQSPSYARGRDVFESHCALCHGDDGQGQRAADGRLAFPPLWGPRSYNWGAGMHRVNTAAAFIKANMPLGATTLSDQQAWDVAQFINSHERPQDPRFTGSVEETAERFHGQYSIYGQTVDGRRLGANAPPAGTAPASPSP